MPAAHDAAAQQPDDGPAQLALRAEHQEGGQCGGKGAERHPRQDQVGGGHGLPDPRQLVNQRHGEQRAGKGCQRHSQQAQEVIRPVDAHGNHRAQPGPRGHPDQVGVGQRVAEQALVGGPAARQRRPGEGHQQGARQAQLNRMTAALGSTPAGSGPAAQPGCQQLQHRGGRNEHRPHAHAQHERQRQKQESYQVRASRYGIR